MIASAKFIIAIWVLFIIWMVWNTRIRAPTPRDAVFGEGAGNTIAVFLGGALAVFLTILAVPFVIYESYS